MPFGGGASTGCSLGAGCGFAGSAVFLLNTDALIIE